MAAFAACHCLNDHGPLHSFQHLLSAVLWPALHMQDHVPGLLLECMCPSGTMSLARDAPSGLSIDNNNSFGC